MPNTTHHAGEAIALMPSAPDYAKLTKTLLIKHNHFKVVRLTLPAEQHLPDHKAPGELVVQCVSGLIEFSVGGSAHLLRPQNVIYVPTGELHAVRALEDSVILLTIVTAE